MNVLYLSSTGLAEPLGQSQVLAYMRGLSGEQQALCDMVVNIPMVGSSDSLNLAVATGSMLYEIFNQQRVALRNTG